MKFFTLLVFFLSFCCVALAQNSNDRIAATQTSADTIRKESKTAESAARKAALNSLKCKWGCESLTLYKDGKISKQGIFKNHNLFCGIHCIYDPQGKLIQIKKYEEGKYIGDVKFP